MKLDYTPISLRTGIQLSQERMRNLIRQWPGYGIIYGTQTVDAPDPENSKRDMAILLCQHEYSLSEDLLNLLPKADDVPDDAVA